MGLTDHFFEKLTDHCQKAAQKIEKIIFQDLQLNPLDYHSMVFSNRSGT